jgi:hypothetical protein
MNMALKWIKEASCAVSTVVRHILAQCLQAGVLLRYLLLKLTLRLPPVEGRFVDRRWRSLSNSFCGHLPNRSICSFRHILTSHIIYPTTLGSILTLHLHGQDVDPGATIQVARNASGRAKFGF